MKPGEGRQRRLAVLLGAPGSGKSSLAWEWIDAARAEKVEVRILDPNAQFGELGEWPDGARVDEWLEDLRASGFSGLIVLDDADLYLDSSARSVWRDLFSSFRHWQCDVLVSSRRTQEIPKMCVANASFVAIFRLREPNSRDYVRRYLGEDAVAAAPREPFRYALVDVDSGEISEYSTRPRPELG